jgi:ribosomal protein L21
MKMKVEFYPVFMLGLNSVGNPQLTRAEVKPACVNHWISQTRVAVVRRRRKRQAIRVYIERTRTAGHTECGPNLT